MFFSFKRLSAVAATLALAGCVTNGMDAELTRCTFPDSTRTPAPSFICGEPIDGFHLTRLTSVPASDTTSTQDRIETGRLDIQQAMALEWLEGWFGHLSGDDTDTARQVILTWLDEELRVVRTRTSPTGTLWLLTGLPDPEDTVQARVRARLVAAGVLIPPSAEPSFKNSTSALSPILYCLMMSVIRTRLKRCSIDLNQPGVHPSVEP